MKNYLIILTILLGLTSFSQDLTRGPELGEIYFQGPTATVLYDAIYRSTNFGETAACVDSISGLSNTIEGITADKTVGGLYFRTMGEALYYSGNYGQYGSWEFKHSGIYSTIVSGRNEGEIYKSFISHSDNYGSNFTSHSCNGYYGTLRGVDIDVSENIGYCISKKYNINDTLYFFNSTNNFDNLEVVKKFNFGGMDGINISRENNEGNLFLINRTSNELLYTTSYGVEWDLKNRLTCPNLPIVGMTGGRQDGELYLLVKYLQLMGLRRHVYIYHSLDYGKTFTVYHPVSIGPDPIYANFITEDTLLEPNNIVQFTDLSNDAETWEWDFDDDGTIDSYEQNPTHSYQDTGYYTVKLSITGYGGVIQDYGIRYNYIHVKNLVGFDEQNFEYEIDYYPNPFNDQFSVEINQEIKMMEIYDLNGKSHFSKTFMQENKTEIIDLRELEKGIYILKIKTEGQDLTKKIIKI